MTSELKCPFRQGYEKPLHYPCTVLMKAKPGCSYDKRLYCDIFSLYYKCEKEWDMSDLKDKIEWWCYATDLERYIKQSQKDLEIARKALEEMQHWLGVIRCSMISHLNNQNNTLLEHYETDPTVQNIDKAKSILKQYLEQIEHKE